MSQYSWSFYSIRQKLFRSTEIWDRHCRSCKLFVTMYLSVWSLTTYRSVGSIASILFSFKFVGELWLREASHCKVFPSFPQNCDLPSECIKLKMNSKYNKMSPLNYTYDPVLMASSAWCGMDIGICSVNFTIAGTWKRFLGFFIRFLVTYIIHIKLATQFVLKWLTGRGNRRRNACPSDSTWRFIKWWTLYWASKINKLKGSCHGDIHIRGVDSTVLSQYGIKY
jgi:hypothetical protein